MIKTFKFKNDLSNKKKYSTLLMKKKIQYCEDANSPKTERALGELQPWARRFVCG